MVPKIMKSHRLPSRGACPSYDFSIGKAIILLLILLAREARGKLVSGDFKLSGVDTERVLTSFLVVPKGANVDVDIRADKQYRSRLTFRAYKDDVWKAFKKASTCSAKIRLAAHHFPVEMEAMAANTGWKASIKFEIEKDERLTARNTHWYFVVDDCSLEEYFHDNAVPKFHYEIAVRNYRGRHGRFKTHMDAHQLDLPEWHAVAFLIAFVAFWYLCATAVMRLSTGAYEVHVAVLWVLLATCCDMWEAIFEIAHLQLYHENGTGSYVIDALAAYAAALCDSAFVIVLLSIAAGWTLPPAHSGGIINANAVQSAMQKLSGSPSNIRLIGGVVLFHMIVAQWGRMTNDECESYHDLEHWPGRFLVWSRVVGGLVFQGTVQQTLRKRQQNQELSKFYRKFAIAGTIWFFGLPTLSWFCSLLISTHRRRMTMAISSTLFQSFALLCLAWLVTTKRTAFHKNSRMGTAPTEESLTDRLAAPGSSSSPSAWMIGRKAKLRFD